MDELGPCTQTHVRGALRRDYTQKETNMRRLRHAILAASTVAVSLATLSSGALAFGGTAIDEDRNGDAWCWLKVERTMIYNDEDYRIETDTIGVMAYLSEQGSIPPNIKAEWVLSVDTIVLRAWDAEGNVATCIVPSGRWLNGSAAALAGAGGPGVGPFTPPPGCVGAACNPPPPPPGCVGNGCNPPPPPCDDCNPPPPPEKQKGNEGVGNGDDPPPPGHDENQNDGEGTSPGNPGNKGGNKP